MYPPAANDNRAKTSSAAPVMLVLRCPARSGAGAITDDVFARSADEGVIARPGKLGNRSRKHLRDDQEQIGVAGLLPGGGQQGMRLATMMGLVIEEMGDEEPLRSGDLALRGTTEPY